MLRSFKARLSRRSSTGGSASSQDADQGHSNDVAAGGGTKQARHNRHSVTGTTPTAASSSTAYHGSGSSHNQHATTESAFQAAGKAFGKNIKASFQHRVGNHQQSLEPTTAADQLSRFDACVEAADALAATAGTDSDGKHTKVLPPRKDAATGIDDVSVLVSPDGDLLLIPNDYDRDIDNGSSGDNPKQEQKSLFSELMLNGKDEYESAVFLGNDLKGDEVLNGFSAVGWSIPATTAALQQTRLSLKDALDFTENIVLTKKEASARTIVACNDLRNKQPSMGGSAPDWEILEIHHDEETGVPVSAALLPSSPNRVGPLCAPSSSINAAVCELERYHFTVAERESQRWRKESQHRKGCLAALRQATASFEERCKRRQDAIQHTSSRVRKQEEQLSYLKAQAEHAWNAVYEAEDMVTQRVEAIMQERSRMREQQRLEQIKQQHDDAFKRNQASAPSSAANLALSVSSVESGGAGTGDNSSANNNITDSVTGTSSETPTLGATSEEIWNLVNSVAESMEDGSFEPMCDDMPGVPLSIPRDKSSDAQDLSLSATNSGTDPMLTTTTISSGDNESINNNTSATSSPTNALDMVSNFIFPVASREQIELEVGLPRLRSAAMMADDMVADSADALMNLLTAMDTTRRSARVAAETSLLSACNAQAACIKSLVKLERESLEERLKELEAVENVVDRIDVRTDLSIYITKDKRERGGISALGDDEDGGIASALAILSRHVDGSLGYDPTHRMSVEDGNQQDDSESSAGSDSEMNVGEILDEAVEKIFDLHPSKSEGIGIIDIAENIDYLCRILAQKGRTARAKRSSLCYSLNAKRSARAEIASRAQFDALCKLFKAILTGCKSEEGGVSTAKMCIMLAQTFYMVKDKSGNLNVGGDKDEISTQLDDLPSPPVGSPPRSQRVYIKSYLKDHPIWNKDDFWDQALSQQISESLTHSGVMSNFEKSSLGRGKERKKSEWTEMRKTKWYDLTYKERIQAASQVQAVVFAQLGALAHSMMELGCGLKRSCSFVRRMAVRHQLPSSQRTMLLQHLVSRNDIELDGDGSATLFPDPEEFSKENTTKNQNNSNTTTDFKTGTGKENPLSNRPIDVSDVNIDD